MVELIGLPQPLELSGFSVDTSAFVDTPFETIGRSRPLSSAIEVAAEPGELFGVTSSRALAIRADPGGRSASPELLVRIQPVTT